MFLFGNIVNHHNVFPSCNDVIEACAESWRAIAVECACGTDEFNRSLMMGRKTEGASGRGRQEEQQEQENARRKREERVEPGDEALNDARALQQMSEGVVDASEEFERIEDKR
jgi:hypothetical protein